MKKISILIAVRNEERIILSCLENLKTAINHFYKEEKNKSNFKLKILIGNDNDEKTKDKSAEIINYFIQSNENSNYKYVKIDKSNQKNLKGKANVIHQLINHSEGETIILLDADVLVNKNWLLELVEIYYKNDNTRMVMGTTVPIVKKVNQKSFFNNFQTIDWILGQGILSIFSKLGFPQTVMGNNLVFDKKIYQEIGGYEKIQFSVTEDVALFKAFQNHCQTLKSVRELNKQNKNQFFIHLFTPNSLAFTEAESNLKNWILQRHRWLCGAWQFSNFFKKTFLLLYLFRIIFFIGIVTSGNNHLILTALIALLIILGINFLLSSFFLVKLKLNISFFIFLHILTFCLIESFLYALVGIYFLKTKKVKWKGRKF